MPIWFWQSFCKIVKSFSDWTTNYGYENGGGGGMSAAPIYLGLMAMVGAFLIKNSARYIFTSEDYNKIAKEGKENEW